MPAWVAPVAAAALGFFGGERANRANRGEAERNRRFQAGEAALNRSFQERMRNTEWQAAVEDMRAAGINPAVAYSRGGASSPGGSMAGGSLAAPAHDSVSSAMQAMMAKQQMELTASTIEKVKAEAGTAKAIALREGARNLGYGISERDGHMVVDYSMPGLVQETQAGVAAAVANAARTKAMADITGLGGQVAQGFQEMMPAFGRIMDVAGQGADSLAGAVEMLERVARMRDSAVQAYFGIPKKAFTALLEQIRRRRN